ncbi:Rib/alpha-like domain-containing protein [Alloscardovia criceti]|uniref:Rib/alpha-like domain-containing protein n=1 Tax=Alloscardovia criceti TaxID=356828 RepID=UPI00035E8BF8|nr:Rib/alpha-like domain-containing protein [Alloscardovia criceti]
MRPKENAHSAAIFKIAGGGRRIIAGLSALALVGAIGVGGIGAAFAADGTSTRAIDTETHYSATGIEDSDLRYSKTNYIGVNSDGTITLEIVKWADGITGWGTSTTNEWAGKYVLSFMEDEFYKQIDTIQVKDSGAYLQKYFDGATWAVPIAVTGGVRPGPAGSALQHMLTIKLKNGATLESLGLADEKLNFESVWIKGDGAIASDAVSTGFIQQNNPDLVNEKDNEFSDSPVGGGVSDLIVMDPTTMRINSVHTVKPTENYLQTDYGWVVYIREQIPEELLPFIDTTGTQLYNSDAQGKYVDTGRTKWSINTTADGRVDTGTDSALSIAQYGDDLTLAQLNKARDNTNDVFWGTLGQPRSYTISYKLKDGVSLKEFTETVKKLVQEDGKTLNFQSDLVADYQNKYIFGGLVGKADNGATPKVLTNSYANSYVQSNDTDNDGIFDFVEFAFGYNNTNVDTDGDGVPDPQELYDDNTVGTDGGQYKVNEPTTQTTTLIRSADSTITGTMPKTVYDNPADTTQKIHATNEAAGNAIVKLVQAEADGTETANGTVYATYSIPLNDLESGAFTLSIPANTIPSNVTKAVLVGSDPKGVNTSTGTVITIVENQADQYEPIGKDTVAKPGDTAPDPATLITNKSDLPDGTTYTWETTPDLSNEGEVPATIVVTYPDGSTDKVTINIAVTENATQAQTYSARGGSLTKGYGEMATLDDLSATITYDPELADGVTPTVALANGASIPTSGIDNDIPLVITYPDGSTDDVTVTLSYQTAAEKYTATGGAIEKEYGSTLTADELANAVTVTPDKSAVGTIAPVDPDNLPTAGKINMVPMVVTYKDGSSENVNVAVAFGTATEKYTTSAKEVIRKPMEGSVTLEELQNNIAYSPELANASDVKSVALLDGEELPTSGINTVDMVVTYADDSTDTVPMRVIFGTDAERNNPQGQDVTAVLNGDAPSASTAIANPTELTEVSSIEWKDSAPDTSTVGEKDATVVITYSDGTADEVPVKVNVLDTRADSNKYDAQGGELTKPYGQTATEDELKAKITFTGEAPADNSYSIALADGVTIPTSGKNNAVVFVVTYADKTTDTVTVKLSYGDASDAYTPEAQEIAADLGSTPSASEGIANKDALPAGTTYEWQDGAPDTSTAGEKTGTVVVTYPDGTTDEVPVTVTVTDNRKDAAKYEATGGSLSVDYGTKVTEEALAAKVNISPEPADGVVTSTKLADGVTIPSNGKNLPMPMVVTYADGSTDTATVTLSYGDAADAYTPTAQPIEVTAGTTPVASDGIANKDDLPAGTTYEWKDGAPDTSTAGDKTGTVVVTYPDGTTDEVEVTVTAKPQKDAYNPQAKDVTVPLNGTLPDANTTITNLDELPAGTTAAWTTSPDTSTAGEKSGVITVTYPDGSTEDVTVSVKVGTDADAYTPTAQQVTVQTGADVPDAKSGIENAADLPDGTTYEWVKDPDTSTAGESTAFVKVTYPDNSSDIVEVPIKVGSDADLYDPQAKDDILVPVNGDVPTASDTIKNWGDLPSGTTAEWTETPDTSKAGNTTGTVTVTYPDGSKDTVTVPVKVGKDNDIYEVELRDTIYTPIGTVPDAAGTQTVTGDDSDVPAGTTFAWKEDPDVSKAGTVKATVVVTFPDNSTYEKEISVVVSDPRPASIKYNPQGGTVTKPYGQTATLKDLTDQVTFTGDDKPEANDYRIKLADKVTIPSSGKNNAVVLVVDYWDGTSDTVTVTLSYADAADSYTPEVAPIATDLGETPAASDGIANKDDLPDGTTYEWKDGAPDTSDAGEKTGTVVVTYPDGTTDEVDVTVNVTDNRTDATKYDATAEALNVPYGTKVTEEALAAKVSISPTPAEGVVKSIKLAEGTSIPTNGKNVAVQMVVTYADGSTDAVSVPLTYGDASDAYTPTAQGIEVTAGTAPVASDGIANKDDLPAGTTYEWKDVAPDTSTAGEKTGTVVVTYPDGTTDEVAVTVTVKTMSDAYDPQGQEVKVDTGKDLPDAKDGVKDADKLPDGTTVTWDEPKPDTTKPGSTTGTVTITYPDGSKDTVTVPVKVGTDAEAYNPEAQAIEVKKGDATPDARDGIKNAGDLPDGTTFEWVTEPDTSKPGTSTSQVKVTYPDGSSDTVDVTVKITSDADAYTAIGQDVKVDKGAQLPDASNAIKNLADLPQGTTVEWKNAPDTTEAGFKKGSVLVTFPDGSTQEVEVNVKVGSDADIYNPEGKDITTKPGDKTPNPSDAIGNLDDLPAGTVIDWTKTPDTSKPGTSEGTVRITYPDGSSEEITVKVTVEDTDNGNNGQNGQNGQNDQNGNDANGNGNKGNAGNNVPTSNTGKYRSTALVDTGANVVAIAVATLGFIAFGWMALAARKRRDEE